MKVLGADGEVGGTVTDVWVDRAEPQIRYLELEVKGAQGAARRVLLPINFARVKRAQGEVLVKSILGRHFANVPGLAKPDQVTLREEDKVCAYYAGGTLYAKAERAEPLL
jgi:photosynthetic reaction center H subunit